MDGRAFCIVALSGFLTAWQPVQAASFDCAKAQTDDEKAICSDRALNDQDVEMSVLYTQLKPFSAWELAVTWKTRKLPGSSGARAVAATAPA
jgi:hypothetical protein